MEEKKYPETLKQNLNMYICLFVLLEKNEDNEAIIILELVKPEKTY